MNLRCGLCIFLFFCATLAQADERVLQHRYGETVISGSPSRIVSLSFIGHDYLLGLGEVPLALRYWYGDGPFGVWPWAADRLGEAEPVVIYGAIDVETIALLEPDLILAQWSGITETEYRLLSRIAPVLPPPAGASDYTATWQQMLRQIGIALDKADAAEAQIAEIEGRFADIRARYPAWQGKTAVSVWPDRIGAYTRSDLRGQFLEQLGFINAPQVEALVGANTYNVRISPENLDPIDTDLLIWLTISDPAQSLSRITLRPMTRAFREGREVIADPDLTAALSHSSPLALAYALDRLEPMIAAAMDGDPATAVPIGVGDQ
ncbi:MAG: ABC transporter substrate-binding protein [Pseudomonadota bacterium]